VSLLRKSRIDAVSDNMKTKLYSDIIRRRVDVPNRREKTKLVEIVASIGGKHWYAEEVMIESGLIDKEGYYYPTSAVEGLDGEDPLTLNAKSSGKEKTKRPDSYLLSGMIKNMVIDSSGEELGRVYDFEIYVDRNPWIIWKLLVNPVGLKPTKKRIRIPTSKVSNVSSDKIHLK